MIILQVIQGTTEMWGFVFMKYEEEVGDIWLWLHALPKSLVDFSEILLNATNIAPII
jgi:hypothetical protein